MRLEISSHNNIAFIRIVDIEECQRGKKQGPAVKLTLDLYWLAVRDSNPRPTD